MLPNSRSDSETGFASSATLSRMKLNAMMKGAPISPRPLVGGAIGCIVSSPTKPVTPLYFTV